MDNSLDDALNIVTRQGVAQWQAAGTPFSAVYEFAEGAGDGTRYRVVLSKEGADKDYWLVHDRDGFEIKINLLDRVDVEAFHQKFGFSGAPVFVGK